MQVQDSQPALPLRSHTILGACEAIGEDFGFNPVYLRVPFAGVVLFSPLAAIGAYLGLSLLVLVSRLAFPNPKTAAASAEAPAGEQAAAANDKHDAEDLRAAA